MCTAGRFLFVQAEDGIRDLVRSRGLGDVYERQGPANAPVVIEHFSDFQCPFCNRVVPTVEQVRQRLSLIHI